jgi:hypothetical protein
METNKKIQNLTGNIPLVSGALGAFGTNLLGIGHELSMLNFDDPYNLRESGEDIINNFVGSVAGSIPFVSDKKKREVIQYLSDKGILPDGTTAARGRVYEVVNKNKKYAIGGSLPGATGMMYARTAGAAPSEGPYAKKTLPSAQDGGKKMKISRVQKPADDLFENLFEIIDPTGISSWDDIYRSYNKTGMSPQTKVEILGAIPMVGKLAKVGKIAEATSKTFSATARQKRNADAAAKALKIVGKTGPAAGRVTDAYQAYDEYQNGGSMSFYQHGLDWKPRNISRDGSSVNRADEYPLQKLDDLLNFTNYNKPKAKSGGWLDKYN